MCVAQETMPTAAQAGRLSLEETSASFVSSRPNNLWIELEKGIHWLSIICYLLLCLKVEPCVYIKRPYYSPCQTIGQLGFPNIVFYLLDAT